MTGPAAVAAALILGLGIAVGTASLPQVPLYGVGIALGVTLYHGAFGFTGAYRALFKDRDLSGLTAQAVMLLAAMALFAPLLAGGTALGRPVVGAVAPVGISMLFGAALFGVGMQLGGGCGSGTLFTVGGGNPRMAVTLLFFCLGGFQASLDLPWWGTLPQLPAIALGDAWGYGPALAAQGGGLLALLALLRRRGFRDRRALWWDGPVTWARLLRGPWPLLFSGLLLALFNWLTLILAGHPWSITWGFTLWAAKAARTLGWDPHGSAFWVGGFPERALNAPLLTDVTTVMDLGIILGALLAAALAGRLMKPAAIAWRPLAASVIGGLMLGYGARLAYGCNIGAFFSGVASTSLHGWAWIVAALAGNWLGVRLRPLFRLDP